MNSNPRRTGLVLIRLLLLLIAVLTGPVRIAAAQSAAPRVLAYIQEVKDGPSLLVAFTPTQPGAYTQLAARSDTYPFPLISPDSKWMVTWARDEGGESYTYKPVGTPTGNTFAVIKEKDEKSEPDNYLTTTQESIECCVFSDDSRFLLFRRFLPFSTYSARWSVNIIELATGVQTTFGTTDRRVKRRGPLGPEVMTELTEIVPIWRTADKQIFFRKYLRFDEADDYPQTIPIGFSVLDLRKFDLSKGGTFTMPPMAEFSRANFSAELDLKSELPPKVFTFLPIIAPDTTQLAYTYGYYGVYVPIGVGILDLRTAKFTEVSLGTDSPRSLRWTSDSKQLVFISAKPGSPNYYEYRDYRVNVLDVASGKVLQSVVVDAEGKMRWIDALLCGDTLFMTTALITPTEAPPTMALFSALLTDPAKYIQLFSAASIQLVRCA